MKNIIYTLLISIGGLMLMGFDFSQHNIPTNEIKSGGPPQRGQ